MGIPALKRVKVTSEQQLRTWLRQSRPDLREVMIVTNNRRSRETYLGTAQVRDVVGETGWTAVMSYTLPGNQLGHVIRQGA